jgi:hypothetical protein
MDRVGQNRIYTPYMTVYLVISLPKISYIHRIYMVLANPTNGVIIICLHLSVVFPYQRHSFSSNHSIFISWTDATEEGKSKGDEAAAPRSECVRQGFLNNVVFLGLARTVHVHRTCNL